MDSGHESDERDVRSDTEYLSNKPFGNKCELAECRRESVFSATGNESFRTLDVYVDSKQFNRRGRHYNLPRYDRDKSGALFLSRRHSVNGLRWLENPPPHHRPLLRRKSTIRGDRVALEVLAILLQNFHYSHF
jgi:hypothetical protein